MGRRIWVAVRSVTVERRPGGLGTVGGPVVVAALLYGSPASTLEIEPRTLGVLAVLGGFAAYALLGEYDRRRSRESFPALQSRS